MAIEVLIERYEVKKYQDENWRSSSATYNKLPIGFHMHSSWDEYSKIKPLRYLHMAHVKIDRNLFYGDELAGKRRCNVALMDRYQYY